MHILNIILILSLSLPPVHRKNNIKKLYGEWTDGRLTVTIKKDNSCHWNAGPPIQFEGVIKSITDSCIHFSFASDIDLSYNYTYLRKNLILWNYKTVGDSLGYHIDEITLLHKSRVRKMKKAIDPDISKRESFQLPNDLNGMVYVCYNQNEIDNNQLNKNTRIIKISEDGLTKTEFIEDPVAFGLLNYKFTRDGKDILFFNSHRVLKKSNKEIESMGYSQDSVYVCLYGYNQTGRIHINEEFNEEIHGNVLMFSVDTLRNILTRQYRFYDPYK